MSAMDISNRRMGNVSDCPQRKLNRRVYEKRGVYRHYLSQALFPQEIACLLKHQPSFYGRDILDIGVGAGRTTRYLAPLARRYEAIDYSSVMVRYMKQAMPEISVRQADFRDLAIFEDSSFDFLLASNNVIDSLSHEDRLQALREANRVLRPGGTLVVASHNIGYQKAYSGPELAWCANPVKLAYRCAAHLWSWWNYLQRQHLRKTTSEYALINDAAHYFALLHYYISPSAMCAQLQAQGFQVAEMFNAFGVAVRLENSGRDSYSILYVAQRVATQAAVC